MQGSCDVPMSPLLTAAALLAGRSTRPRINKPALAPMDEWFPVRSPAGSLVGRVRMVCEVVPVSVNLDDSVNAESGSFAPPSAAPAATTVDANVSAQPSLEVLEIMRARLRTEVPCPAFPFGCTLQSSFFLTSRFHNRWNTTCLCAWLQDWRSFASSSNSFVIWSSFCVRNSCH